MLYQLRNIVLHHTWALAGLFRKLTCWWGLGILNLKGPSRNSVATKTRSLSVSRKARQLLQFELSSVLACLGIGREIKRTIGTLAY